MPDAVAAPIVPVLTVEIKRCAENTAVVYCHGRLVAGTTDVLYKAVCELIGDGKTGTKRIVLDLSDLKHTDSMGLGTLVRLYASAKRSGSNVELMHLSQQIRNLLGLTNLFTVFTVVGENGIKLM
jgi:anti-sigma B factor antagonist